MKIVCAQNDCGILSLPINYSHILQGIIYHALEDYEEVATSAHNAGYEFGGRAYKLFTFGPIRGHFRLCDRNIVFDRGITFEIRSPFRPFINIVGNHIAEHGITVGEHKINSLTVIPKDTMFDSDEYRIKMASPICVYTTDSVSGETAYFNPADSVFYKMIRNNAYKKFSAYYGHEPEGDFSVEVARFDLKDKVVTKYKGFIIEAWKGEYLIKGSPDLLSFLYDTGLGAKNSQGFGMFDIVE